MIRAKLNPTPIERKLKLYRILFKRWIRREGLAVALCLSLIWLYHFCFSVIGMYP